MTIENIITDTIVGVGKIALTSLSLLVPCLTLAVVAKKKWIELQSLKPKSTAKQNAKARKAHSSATTMPVQPSDTPPRGRRWSRGFELSLSALIIGLSPLVLTYCASLVRPATTQDVSMVGMIVVSNIYAYRKFA